MYRTILALALTATAAQAEITVDNARFIAAFETAKAGGGFLTILNDAEPDALIGVAAEGVMAQVHETVEDGGVMKMQHVERLDIPQGETLLERGGLHIMLMGLTPELLAEDSIPVTLIFENAGEIEIDLPVQIGIETDQGDG